MLVLDRPLAILDLEATSTDPSEARIIQIAVSRLVPNDDHTPQVAESFETLVDPQVEIPSRVQDLTGIPPADVEGAPHLNEIGHRLHELLGDADLCGYNAISYDVPLLEAECQRAFSRSVPGPEDREIVDPYRLEKALVKRSLSALFERYTGDVLDDAHDAMTDAMAAWEVLNAQLNAHTDAERHHTAADLAQLQRGDYLDDDRKLKKRDDGAVEVCFGKYRGKTLQQLADEEPGYFDWMYKTIDDLRPHIDNALS